MNREELLELKERIDKAKAEKSSLEGKRELLVSELKKFGCNFENAMDKLQAIKKKISDLKEQRDRSIELLQQRFELHSNEE